MVIDHVDHGAEWLECFNDARNELILRVEPEHRLPAIDALRLQGLSNEHHVRVRQCGTIVDRRSRSVHSSLISEHAMTYFPLIPKAQPFLLCSDVYVPVLRSVPRLIAEL